MADEPEVEEGKELEFLEKEEPEVKAETPEEPKEEINEPEEEPKKEDKPISPDHFQNLQKALDEERSKRKELREKLEAQERRFQEFMEKSKPKEEPQFETEEDRLRYEHQQTVEQIKQQQEFINQQRQLTEQQQREQSVIRVYATKAKEFATQTPDFNDAYQFMYQSRQNELIAAGYPVEGDPRRNLLPLDEFLKREELGIVQNALMDEANPAERVYKIAQARGYQKKEKPKEGKLETIEKGMKAKSLSGVTGSSPKGLTLEALADMPDDEFSKLSFEEIERIAGQ